MPSRTLGLDSPLASTPGPVPSAQARPPQPCHRVLHPGTGPVPGEDHLRAEAEAWARRCPAHTTGAEGGQGWCARARLLLLIKGDEVGLPTRAPTVAEDQVVRASLRESRTCDSCRCLPGSQGRMARRVGWEGRNTVTGQAACLPTHRLQTGQPVPGVPSPASLRCRLPRPAEAPWTHLAPGLWQQRALQRGSTLAE